VISAGVVVIFEFRMRPDADLEAYGQLSEEMNARAASDPRFGFLGMSGYGGDDGTTAVLEHFRDMTGMRAWASDPKHREAQRRGREEFYAWYRVRVCNLERDYTHGEVPASVSAEPAYRNSR
jgi:heme-degrading monooxygenase HmoA